MNHLQEKLNAHVPVMSTETIKYLNPKSDGIYIDGTIGAGGHANQILSMLSPKGKLIGIDRDEEALKICEKRFSSFKNLVSLHHTSYDNIKKILDELGIQKVDGMLLDLGLSSLQLNSESRGFSFKKNGRIDMRFDKNQDTTAADLIKSLSENELADIIFQFGEERRSRRISKAIKQLPKLLTTNDIKEAIRKSTPPHHRNKTLARVFQAIRIAVNDEIDKLIQFLKVFINYLNIGGRLVIISYHSLEDRLVKKTFRSLKEEKKVILLTKKPLTPQKSEINENNKSRSAKFRALESMVQT
ncbi:MAG: 16S rRNA (cytosine(1402)-N(4))-methyltransferase RsmH [Candidatus Neomarinimicrobiota bacterium]|nr:16S rRNA (cytosine(1402)-N(4))-methyltransferase RsmH [Candidatus Neomarinimicrobiota bacterium]